jgi:nucleoside-triphosphatase THEP1
MPRLTPAAPITALIYGDGGAMDALMARIAGALAAEGLLLAGFIQRNQPRANRRRCDMVLEDLATGEAIAISEDRGPHARGCHLDTGELLRGMELGRAALAGRPDLLIINKFGKTEGEGGGFRPLMAEAMLQEVPMLLAVPWRNIDGWRVFAGGLACEIPVERVSGHGAALLAALGMSISRDPGRTATTRETHP